MKQKILTLLYDKAYPNIAKNVKSVILRLNSAVQSFFLQNRHLRFGSG